MREAYLLLGGVFEGGPVGGNEFDDFLVREFGVSGAHRGSNDVLVVDVGGGGSFGRVGILGRLLSRLLLAVILRCQGRA